MKYIKILLALLFISTLKLSAQDIVYLKDGSSVETKIIKIDDNEIEYKKLSYLDGPSYTISIAKIDSIQYPNGDIDRFSSPKQSVPKVVKSEVASLVKVQIDKQETLKQLAEFKGNLLQRGNNVYVKPHNSSLQYEIAGANEKRITMKSLEITYNLMKYE